jgi:cardiolipin synthase
MSRWTEEKIFADGDSFFESLLDAIQKARVSIDLQTYIFSNDPLGERILAALKSAANRKVQIRLLLDGIGSYSWTEQDAARLRSTNFQIKFFHPLPWQVSTIGFFSSLGFQKNVKRLFELNQRNHRKCCTIDASVAYLGGMNISGKHLVEFSGREAWRDTSVRVTGENVIEFSELFELAWRPVPFTGHRINRNARKRLQLELIDKILGAEQRVWLMTPYFSPSLGLLKALNSATQAGIDVRLLIPQNNDIIFMKSLAQAYYWVLLRQNVKIYEYSPSILHGKVSLVDQWLKVGSSNLNYRSLIHDLELDVTLSKPESIQSAERQFEIDFSRSNEVSIETFKNRSYLIKLLEWLAYLFKEWS